MSVACPRHGVLDVSPDAPCPACGVAAYNLEDRGARDVVVAGAFGNSAWMDAYNVAFRIPNFLRRLFGEGAFNAAFVPSYARVLETKDGETARSFSGQILTLLLISQIVLLALAWLFMPQLVALLAPGFDEDPEKFNTAVALTRITTRPSPLMLPPVTRESTVL